MAQIDSDSVFWTQILFADPAENFGLEFVQTFFRGAGDSERLEILPITVLGQIALIQHDNFISVDAGPLEMRGPRSVSIDDVQAQVGLLHRTLSPRDSLALNVGRRCSKAGGVEKTNRDAAKVYGFFDRVPGCSM